MSYALTLAAALALTVLSEGLGMLIIGRSWRFVYYSLLGNLLTWPALNLLLITVGRFGPVGLYRPALLVLELAAVVTEALLYRTLCHWPLKKALPISLALNVLSYALGVLLEL